MSEIWSDAEVEATLKAYLWMLQEQSAGREFVKAEVIRDLRAGVLKNRTKSSVERRFQNYSSVFSELDLPWVRGYVPLGHVGARVKELVKSHLAAEGLPLTM